MTEKFFPGTCSATGEHWRPCCQAKDGGCRPHLVELPCQGALVPPQLNSGSHYFTSVYFTTIHLTYRWSLPHCHLLQTPLGLSLCSLQTLDFSSVISTNVGQLRWQWPAGKYHHNCSISQTLFWLAGIRTAEIRLPFFFFFSKVADIFRCPAHAAISKMKAVTCNILEHFFWKCPQQAKPENTSSLLIFRSFHLKNNLEEFIPYTLNQVPWSQSRC